MLEIHTDLGDWKVRNLPLSRIWAYICTGLTWYTGPKKLTTDSPILNALIIDNQELQRIALMDVIKTTFQRCFLLGVPTLERATRVSENINFTFVIASTEALAQSPRTSIVERFPNASFIIVGKLIHTAADEMLRSGVSAIIDPARLNRYAIGYIFREMAGVEYLARYQPRVHDALDLYFSDLTEREQMIMHWMLQRSKLDQQKSIYEKIGATMGIEADTIQKHHKTARSKLKRHTSFRPKPAEGE